VEAGEFIMANLDIVLGNDITTPVAQDAFERMEAKEVFDKDKVVIVPDHFTPNRDIRAAMQCQKVRNFAHAQDITNYFEVGEVGIEHALLPEKGLVGAGQVIIGADSHTCTYGALGAFATGVGSTDMAAGMALGRTWFRVPEAIKVTLTGAMQEWVSGKDVILHLIGLLGVDGATYQSLEFVGDGIANLTMDDRFTIANMAIEAGAKNGIFPVDDKTIAYMEESGVQGTKIYEADEDAEYVREVTIDLSTLSPTVAFPHLPENTHAIEEIEPIEIDQVVIGSCTNGRLEDLRIAAEVFKGRKVKKGVRVLVFPATQKIYRQAMHAGYFDIFLDAGVVISPPTCGPCLGGHMGILAKGERAVATTNRNFIGRMGHVESEVYLASPAVAAESAIQGVIAAPGKWAKGE
jgi:3-isopropylmalate/(R)-2-methylmalate dehydratase large subunit